MPSLAGTLQNAVPTLLLRSPLHRALSRRTLELEFTGRRTGRRFRTPVAYTAHGDALVISTDSPWWRNFATRPDVRLRLRGRRVSGSARVIRSRDEAHAALRALTDAVPGYWRPAGIERERGVITDAALDRSLASGRRVVRLEVA